jgi:pimeloyl-ACP methyl ester carboxylesterase
MCIPPPFSRQRDPRTAAIALSYQGPISTPLLGRFIVRHGFAGRILRIARGKGEWTDEEVRTYDDVFRARPHVTVGVYRTFLTRELVPLARGRYVGRPLEVPTTLLVGDRDRITKSVRAEDYPDLTVRRIEGVGHFLPEEAPEAVLAALS